LLDWTIFITIYVQHYFHNIFRFSFVKIS